ncbi:MAG TPA: hypothetical protein VNN80_27555 [Polyangiaceae bacterium]|nr:hypothetical protein [Polyangiaceae bacterium]
MIESAPAAESVAVDAPVEGSVESDIQRETGEPTSVDEPPPVVSEAPSAASPETPAESLEPAEASPPGGNAGAAAPEASTPAASPPEANGEAAAPEASTPAASPSEGSVEAAAPEASTPAASPPEGSVEAAAPEASTPAEEEPAPVEAPAADPCPTMQTSGRQLLDTCGNVFVARGVEQIFGEQLPRGNDWPELVEQISESGVNAVRILAGTDTLETSDVDALLDVVAEAGMVAYITPYGDEGTYWLEHQEVREMLAEHEKYIIIDAFGEPTFDDRERFLEESTAAIERVRRWGYRVPLTVTANQYGRDLPSIFELGPQIVAADPLGNTILGWQAYWGSSGYYNERYDLSFEEALDAISRASFPIQLGLDHVTDSASETADFGALMSASEEHGVGWLWWDWYNPYGDENNLSEDGSADNLTPTGRIVVASHAASVQETAKRVCVR